MSAYLVISAIGQDRPGIVDEVSAFVLAHECNVEDSRMAVLGGDFALIMLVSGAEAEVEKLDGHLGELEKQSGLTVDDTETLQRPHWWHTQFSTALDSN